jgi:hypothetical protein
LDDPVASLDVMLYVNHFKVLVFNVTPVLMHSDLNPFA